MRYIALLIGYLSHLIADCATKSGVPLFYPNLTPCVIPANDKYRVHTGSLTGEGLIFLVLLAVTLAFVPISNIGLWRAVHYMMGTQEAAYADFREIEERRTLRHRIEVMELELLQDSLRRPPVHYLELQQKRLRIEELRRELSRMDHPDHIRLTGSLSIRSSGE